VERRGDELPEELRRREDRLKKIQEAKQRLEDRQKEEDRAAGRSENDGGWASGVRPQGGRSRHHREFGEVPEKKTENFTDPQSRIMKTQDGFQQCYNGQIAVESESGLIVANDVGSECSGQRMLGGDDGGGPSAGRRKAGTSAGGRGGGTGQKKTFGSWRRKRSRRMWRWGGKAREAKTFCRARKIRTRKRCRSGCEVKKDATGIANGSGWRSRRSGGSSTYWASGASVCGATRKFKRSGNWSARR